MTATVKPWAKWLTAADEPVVLRALRKLRDDLGERKTDEEEKVLDTLIGELNVIERGDAPMILSPVKRRETVITRGG